MPTLDDRRRIEGFRGNRAELRRAEKVRCFVRVHFFDVFFIENAVEAAVLFASYLSLKCNIDRYGASWLFRC